MVLERSKEMVLRPKPKKCKLFRGEVFPGHILSHDEIKTDPSETEWVLD